MITKSWWRKWLSTVNEVLLTQYLLSTETDPHRRAYIMNHFLEGFRTTVFRQALFAEFERKAHDMYQSGQALTAQTLNALYKDLNEQYYKGAVVTDLMSVEWARHPPLLSCFLCLSVFHRFLLRCCDCRRHPENRQCRQLSALPHDRRQRLSAQRVENCRRRSDPSGYG